jgi:hypothetical protein
MRDDFPRPQVIEVGEIIVSGFHPFFGKARWSDGEIREVVVKPQRAHPQGTAEHLYAEWCGYTLAAALGIPTPRAFIVEISAEVLRPLGREYADIIPGVAFATERQIPVFQCGDWGFPRNPINIRNIDSLAGMVVLDTILWNNDREDDVLAIPVGSTQFELRYIDNTWLVFDTGLTIELLSAQFPRNLVLQFLVRGMNDLSSYLLAAETLDTVTLSGIFGNAPAPLLAAAPGSPEEIAATFADRGHSARDVINRDRPAGT